MEMLKNQTEKKNFINEDEGRARLDKKNEREREPREGQKLRQRKGSGLKKGMKKIELEEERKAHKIRRFGWGKEN